MAIDDKSQSLRGGDAARDRPLGRGPRRQLDVKQLIEGDKKEEKEKRQEKRHPTRSGTAWSAEQARWKTLPPTGRRLDKESRWGDRMLVTSPADRIGDDRWKRTRNRLREDENDSGSPVARDSGDAHRRRVGAGRGRHAGRPGLQRWTLETVEQHGMEDRPPLEMGNPRGIIVCSFSQLSKPSCNTIKPPEGGQPRTDAPHGVLEHMGNSRKSLEYDAQGGASALYISYALLSLSLSPLDISNGLQLSAPLACNLPISASVSADGAESLDLSSLPISTCPSASAVSGAVQAACEPLDGGRGAPGTLIGCR